MGLWLMHDARRVDDVNPTGVQQAYSSTDTGYNTPNLTKQECAPCPAWFHSRPTRDQLLVDVIMHRLRVSPKPTPASTTKWTRPQQLRSRTAYQTSHRSALYSLATPSLSASKGACHLVPLAVLLVCPFVRFEVCKKYANSHLPEAWPECSTS
jgi:hypothetical protein